MKILIVSSKVKEQAGSKIDEIVKKYNLSFKDTSDEDGPAFVLKEGYSAYTNPLRFDGALGFHENVLFDDNDTTLIWFKAKTSEEAMKKLAKLFEDTRKMLRKLKVELNSSDVEKVKQDIIKDYNEANNTKVTNISEIDQDPLGYLIKSNAGRLIKSIEKELTKIVEIKPIQGSAEITVTLDSDAVDGQSISAIVSIGDTFWFEGLWLDLEDGNFVTG